MVVESLRVYRCGHHFYIDKRVFHCYRRQLKLLFSRFFVSLNSKLELIDSLQNSRFQTTRSATRNTSLPRLPATSGCCRGVRTRPNAKLRFLPTVSEPAVSTLEAQISVMSSLSKKRKQKQKRASKGATNKRKGNARSPSAVTPAKRSHDAPCAGSDAEPR